MMPNHAMLTAFRALQLGDYFAAARICGAPVPPPAVISRAVVIQVGSKNFHHSESLLTVPASMPCKQEGRSGAP